MTAEAQSTPSSRRALLAAGLGGIAALLAHALGRPAAVRATDGAAVTAGNEGTLTATKTTGVSTSGGNGLQGTSSDTNASGVYGESPGFGVAGRSSNVGILGDCTSSAGWAVAVKAVAIGNASAVSAESSDGHAVSATAWGAGDGLHVYSATGRAIFASVGGSGGSGPAAIVGMTGLTPVSVPTKTGVFGYANEDTNAQGVLGRSVQGHGVVGETTTGFAVKGVSSGVGPGGYFTSATGDALVGQILAPTSTRTAIVGLATNGAGVSGTATSGRAVSGTASAAGGIGVRGQAPTTGYALDVSGRSRFSRSGKLAIAAGRSYITKTGVPLTSKSLVLAVLQTNRSGIYVRAVVPNVTGASFTIYLNTRVPGTTYVAWFVIEAP
jgi:hypothetical protein